MMRRPPALDPAQTVRQIRIVILALLSGVFIFAAVTVFLLLGDFSTQPELVSPFAIALAILGLGSLAAGDVVQKILTRRVSVDGDSPAKDAKRLSIYLAIKLVRGALAEGFGLAGTVFLLITGNWYFLAAPLLATWILMRLAPRPGDLQELTHSIGPGTSTHDSSTHGASTRGTAIEP